MKTYFPKEKWDTCVVPRETLESHLPSAPAVFSASVLRFWSH